MSPPDQQPKSYTATLHRDDTCPECPHPKYDHDPGRCGQCSCTLRFICDGCNHDWFHHHYDKCEAGQDCKCKRRADPDADRD